MGDSDRTSTSLGEMAYEVLFAVIDIFFVLQDYFFDLIIACLFAETGHYKWAGAAFAIITLPGVAIMMGLAFDGERPSQCTRFWRFLTVLAYPTIIIKTAIETRGQDLIQLRHMKSYDGLLQSSFMFFMQLVVLFTSPSVGTLHGVENGRFWILVIGLISSLLNLIWDVTIYHIVSDGKPSDCCRQIKLMPYYLAHYAFRSLSIAIFFIYMKEWAILVTIMPLIAFNMWLTRKTYKLPTATPQQHLRFCTVVGGWSSFMVPSLSTFFKQTTSARSLNYHYKRNILATNIWFGLIFAGLAIFLNVGPDSSGVDPCIGRLSSNDSKAEFIMSTNSGNMLKRNHLFTCYDNKTPTYDELSLPHLPCKEGSSGYVHKDTFLGQTWWVMLPCEPEKAFSYNKTHNHSLKPVCNITELEDKDQVRLQDRHQDRHLIAKDCEEGEGSIQKFNTMIVPAITILCAISTALAFQEFEMMTD